MPRPTLPSSRSARRIAPLLLASALTFAACGGGSSDKATATSASQSQATTTASTAVSGASTTTTAAPATTSVETTEATSAATSATTSASSGGDATSNADLQKVADAWSKQTSYKITLNVYDVDATSPSFVNITETELDNEHTVTTVAGQSIESITIGSDTYALVAGTWQKSPDLNLGNTAPVNGVDVVGEFTDPETDPVFKTQITKKGDETLDGVATNVYELTDITGTVVTIWVGKDDLLPRKSEIKTDTSRIEVLYSDYGKDFGIKAPI